VGQSAICSARHQPVAQHVRTAADNFVFSDNKHHSATLRCFCNFDLLYCLKSALKCRKMSRLRIQSKFSRSGNNFRRKLNCSSTFATLVLTTHANIHVCAAAQRPLSANSLTMCRLHARVTSVICISTQSTSVLSRIEYG